LGRLKDRRAVSALLATLNHQISNLRKEAALALGEIGAPEALPALEQIQNDPDPEVRKSAIISIAQIRAINQEQKLNDIKS
jgi:HEAT repeat protein